MTPYRYLIDNAVVHLKLKRLQKSLVALEGYFCKGSTWEVQLYLKSVKRSSYVGVIRNTQTNKPCYTAIKCIGVDPSSVIDQLQRHLLEHRYLNP